MIKSLKEARLTDGLPRIVAEQPWAKALSGALGALHERTMEYIVRSQIYTAIDSASEEVLDALAVGWKVDWYDTGYTVQQKRQCITTALSVRRTMGTLGAVKAQANAIWPGTVVEEWFEYGGEPGYYRLRANIMTAEEQERFSAMSLSEIERRLAGAKRFSAHLEGVEYYNAGGTATAYAMAAWAGSSVTDGATAKML